MAINACKTADCNFVYPINKYESLGDSLSSINYNFASLDTEVCNLETDINLKWNPAYILFSQLSGSWKDAVNIVNTNSSCWQDTYTNVSQNSAFFLKPITLVYPYPFTGSTDINTIRTWLNEFLPPKEGNCFNYIVGQEVYIHSPEYLSINRVVTDSKAVGTKTVTFVFTCDCIGRGSFNVARTQTVNCGDVALSLTVPDQFINRFVGLRFVVDSNFEWSGGTQIFG